MVTICGKKGPMDNCEGGVNIDPRRHSKFHSSMHHSAPLYLASCIIYSFHISAWACCFYYYYYFAAVPTLGEDEERRRGDGEDAHEIDSCRIAYRLDTPVLSLF